MLKRRHGTKPGASLQMYGIRNGMPASFNALTSELKSAPQEYHINEHGIITTSLEESTRLFIYIECTSTTAWQQPRGRIGTRPTQGTARATLWRESSRSATQQPAWRRCPRPKSRSCGILGAACAWGSCRRSRTPCRGGARSCTNRTSSSRTSGPS
ncbi:hypothetical protein H257_11973 [Aphanomyces astaci]|uniref:Uncharacterized protein n=1 Tax=Aphanomyces astaci TaxID=112090 RepID=W4G0E8_APHAT|nr:hypothetical protein H257_11973 [Aphanomyces astaci]ETV73155.1 hypothetical protein H257_11973 [Aphanomyces astaci]|eukprot:XP_009837360.1 hypothetical protein H257_11973 [Aphanomyces astaci]